MRSYDKRVENRIGVVMGRLIAGTHQQDHKTLQINSKLAWVLVVGTSKTSF